MACQIPTPISTQKHLSEEDHMSAIDHYKNFPSFYQWANSSIDTIIRKMDSPEVRNMSQEERDKHRLALINDVVKERIDNMEKNINWFSANKSYLRPINMKPNSTVCNIVIPVLLVLILYTLSIVLIIQCSGLLIG